VLGSQLEFEFTDHAAHLSHQDISFFLRVQVARTHTYFDVLINLGFGHKQQTARLRATMVN
jgi:hypothetical protein